MVQNPVSGIHSSEKVEYLIRQKLETLAWKYEYHQTSDQESVVAVVTQALKNGLAAAVADQQTIGLDDRRQAYDLIVAAGGDGTVSAVASALAWSDIPLLILPSGTGNGLARDMSIPLRFPAIRADFPRPSSATSGFRFCGMRLEPVL